MTKISEQITALVGMVEADSAGSDPKPAALALLTDVPVAVLRHMAAEYLASAVRADRRRRALDAERAALAEASDHDLQRVADEIGYVPPATRGIPRKGTSERAEWETCTLAGRDWARREVEASTRFLQNMVTMVDGFAQTLRVEWTAELLDTPFALKDGSTVLWGDATIADHEQRKAMFEGHIRANAEGAARHVQAIETIRESGRDCLRDAVRKVYDMADPEQSAAFFADLSGEAR